MDGALRRAVRRIFAGPVGLLVPPIPLLSHPGHSLAWYNQRMPAGTQPKIHELLAIDTDAGTRLDRFVAAHCPELSRSRVQELIDGGLLLVNGKPAKSSQKLRGGGLITLPAHPRPAPPGAAQSLPLDWLYQDEDAISTR